MSLAKSLPMLAVAAALVVSLTTLGQVGGEGAGFLIFGATLVDEHPSDECLTVPEYDLTRSIELREEPAKLPLAFSSVAVACGALFTYPVTEPMLLEGEAEVRFWVGCELASHDIPEIGTFEYELQRNGEAVHEDRFFGGAWMGPCVDEVVEIRDGGIPTANTHFQAGDNLTLLIRAFASATHPDVVSNLYLATASEDRLATLTATGLPQSVAFPNGTAPPSTPAPSPEPSPTASPSPPPSPSPSPSPEATPTTPAPAATPTPSPPAGRPHEADARDPAPVPGAGAALGILALAVVSLALVRRRRA